MITLQFLRQLAIVFAEVREETLLFLKRLLADQHGVADYQSGLVQSDSTGDTPYEPDKRVEFTHCL